MTTLCPVATVPPWTTRPSPAPRFLDCSEHDGARSAEIPEVKLHLCGAQEWTECSDLGAQSMHAAGQSKWTEWLRLNVRVASEAADARSGQDYQVLVRGHQPRAQGKPVQALQVPSIHAAAPRRRMIDVHRVHVKYIISCRDS